MCRGRQPVAGLTGGEALHLLGRVQGKVDEGYKDELTGRFQLDPSKRVRAYSKGNRQRCSGRALCSRADLRFSTSRRPAWIR